MIFDYFKRPENPSIVLCKINREPISEIKSYNELNYTLNLGEPDALSFKIYEDYPDYDRVETGSIIDFNGEGYYIVTEIDEPRISEQSKSLTCSSYEYTLGKKNIDLTGNADENGDPITTYYLYNEGNTQMSLMHVIITLLPGWSIGEIDIDLLGEVRYFETLSVQSIYNFLFETVSMSFECLFSFDTINKTISATAYDNVGKQTNIFLSNRNLLNELNIHENADGIVTALSCYGSNGYSINSVNPNGTSTIYNFDHYKNSQYLSDGLVDKLNTYQVDYTNNKLSYETKISELKILYEELNTALIALKDEQAILAGKEAEKAALIVSGGNLSSINAEISVLNASIASYTSTYNTIKDISIPSKSSEIQSITNILNISNYFADDWEELSSIIFESTYQDNTFYFSDSMSAAEQMTMAQSLYDHSLEVLAKQSKPTLEFSVEVVDFLKLFDFQGFASELVVGDYVTVEVKEDVFEDGLRITSIDHGYSDNSLTLTFANKIKNYGGMSGFQALLGSLSNSTAALNFNKGSFENWDKEYKNSVSEYISTTLDASVNGIKSDTNNSVTFDKSGIRVRSSIDGGGSYDPEEIWITKNAIALSDDNFDTASLAIGKISLGNTDLFGVVADAIVGQMIIGQNLLVENSSGTFSVDGAGMTVTDMNLTLNNGTSPATLVLNSTDGIKISTGSQDEDTVFQVDMEGNALFKGDITGSSGTFTGIVNASDLQIDGVSITNGANGWLHKNGITVRSDSGDVTFDLNATTGNTTIFGNLFIAGGIIDWTSINEDPLARDTNDIFFQLVNGEYVATNPETFISGRQIFSPEITGGVVTGGIIQGGTYKDLYGRGSFKVAGTLSQFTDYQFNSDTYDGVKLELHDDLSSYTFKMFGNSVMSLGQNFSYLMGEWDFSGANISGFEGYGTAVFG